MALIVRWIEQQKRPENRIVIPTFAGNLVVYLIGNVVTRTEWNLDNSIMVSCVDEGLGKQIQDYLNYSIHSVTVNLQKQGSGFRNKVWNEICKIPVGQVLNYSELAGNIGSGARAVANACRDNPFPGIIPCHRVVSVTGLGGYMGKTSGQWFEIKKKLLAMESDF